ncbi:MAG: cytochrome P450, partial [Nocardioides sp.]|nr:cytochrome P450 [Nocardioides sp.]
MTALDDVPALTRQRFRTTGPVGGSSAAPPRDADLPPGPRWPAIVQTVALMRFRHRFHPWLRQTYGDTYTIRLIPHGRPLVMVTRPEHTKEVFAGDPEVFHAGKGNSILGP